MSRIEGAQVPIGQTVIDGESIEFVWARGTAFVTAQFTERSPRGIANLTGLGAGETHIVPLAHKAWLNRGREAALIEAGRIHFEKAANVHGSDENRGSPVPRPNHVLDDRNMTTPSLFNQARELTGTR